MENSELTYDQRQELERQKEKKHLENIFQACRKWKVLDNNTVQLESGLSFYVRTEWNNKDKMVISGNYPRTKDNDFYRTYGNDKKAPSIGVSKDKDPEKICRDIEKRFIPDFLEHHAKAAQWVKDQDSYSDAQKNNVDTIAKALNEKPYDKTKVSSYNLHIRLEYASRDYVKLEFDDLSIPDALELIAIRKKQLKNKKEG